MFLPAAAPLSRLGFRAGRPSRGCAVAQDVPWHLSRAHSLHARRLPACLLTTGRVLSVCRVCSGSTSRVSWARISADRGARDGNLSHSCATTCRMGPWGTSPPVVGQEVQTLRACCSRSPPERGQRGRRTKDDGHDERRARTGARRVAHPRGDRPPDGRQHRHGPPGAGRTAATPLTWYITAVATAAMRVSAWAAFRAKATAAADRDRSIDVPEGAGEVDAGTEGPPRTRPGGKRDVRRLAGVLAVVRRVERQGDESALGELVGVHAPALAAVRPADHECGVGMVRSMSAW